MTKEKTTRTRHATHPSAVPVVEGDAEGGGGGGLANGPLDGWMRVSTGSCPDMGTSSWEGNAVLHQDSLGSSIFTSPGDGGMAVFYGCR